MRILLPTHTRFVTPGSTELHFYSDRHVRDRVRLHLRRVTENNNTERRTRETTTAKISSVDRTRPRYGDIRKVTEVAEVDGLFPLFATFVKEIGLLKPSRLVRKCRLILGFCGER
ncbi:hypothetical protein KUCAC02_001174 [Chaenocephalus aceratus]|uniref:Uncharacterized protein n=1 Tax=Chaenocephalus aceratus TaxID=36190 RepID=A0ACB9XXU4_CHAAC|nr:hypothetical protein KUCAC02_001174 [Chaenocephalus aceratus]